MDIHKRQSDPLRVVYGQKTIRGAFRAYRKVQSDGRNLVVYRPCWGPIQGVPNVKIDGVTLADLGLVLGTDYNIYLNGSPAADPIMAAREPAWATAPHPTDCVHIVVLFKKPTAQIPAVDVEAFEATIDGMLVFDPAQDPTLTNRYYRSSNPRLAIADFETDERYGCGFPTSIVYGEPNFQEAVTDCDFDLGGGRKRYTWGLELAPTEPLDPEQTLEMMRGHAALQWAYNDGYRKWWVDQDRPNCGVTFANGEGTVGNIKGVSPLEFKGSSEFPTRVVVWFTNTAAGGKRDYAEDPHPGLASGAVELIEWVYEYDGIQTYDQAKRIAMWLRKSHSIPYRGKIRVNAEGLQVLPGSRITLAKVIEWNITTPEDWSVTDCEPTVDRSTWDLTVEPYTNVWDDTLQTQTNYTPPTNPSPYDAPADVTGLTVSGGINVRTTLYFTASASPNVLAYRIYKGLGASVQFHEEIPAANIPTAAQPYDCDAIVERAFDPTFNVYTSYLRLLTVKAVSAGGRESAGVGSAATSAAATTGGSDAVRQAEASLVLANGVNNDVDISPGPPLHIITGPTGAFTITGFNAAGMTGGEKLRLRYNGTQMCTFNTEVTSAVGNQIRTDRGNIALIGGRWTAEFTRSHTEGYWILDFVRDAGGYK